MDPKKMNKYNETFRVDISKNVFDVHGNSNGHNQYKNNEIEFSNALRHY